MNGNTHIIPVGTRYNRLVFLERVDGKLARFKCDCGKIHVARLSHVKDGSSRSCGCIRGTHRESNSPLYRRWLLMRFRCSPKFEQAKDYFLRGIRVCERWNDFTNFEADMGPSFNPKLQLDRIDNDKGYSKENCRWVTQRQNLCNKRTSTFVDTEFGRMHMLDACEHYGLEDHVVRDRIKRGLKKEFWFAPKGLPRGTNKA